MNELNLNSEIQTYMIALTLVMFLAVAIGVIALREIPKDDEVAISDPDRTSGSEEEAR